MTENLKQLIKEQLKLLPKELQEVIDSSEWIKISEEIGKKNLFNDEEINKLQAEIGIVMTGLEEQNLLALHLENQIGLSNGEAQKISEEVVLQIFNPIIKKLSENIKNNLENKKITWEQNLDFVLSGGNYSMFLNAEKNENITSVETNSKSKEDMLINFLKNDDKEKFNI